MIGHHRGIATLTLLLVLGYSASALALSPPQPALRVSMVQLLANPAAYEGRKVQLVGYVHIKFEDQAIYLTKGDADHLNGNNGFWIEIAANVHRQAAHKVKTKPTTNRYFDCKMVLIEGYFTAKKRGHLGIWQGTIQGVSRLLEQTRWFNGTKTVTKP